jgi:hypothetical protein
VTGVTAWLGWRSDASGVTSVVACPKIPIPVRVEILRRYLSAAAWTVLVSLMLYPALASAAERDYVLQWLPPADSQVDGYNVYLGAESGAYSDWIDLGAVPMDPDGVGRSVLTLDAAADYYVSMTAYNGMGESELSNEIIIAAMLCDPALCDDGNPCTADDCSGSHCLHTPLPEETLCASGSGWPQGICRAGVCEDVECVADADCVDGDVCDGVAFCEGYTCVNGPPPECPADTACRYSGCSPDGGCWTSARADGTPCDDGRIDTSDDQCVAGECVGTTWEPECRLDADCSDGVFCNGEELCDAAGACQAGVHPCGAGETCDEVADTCVAGPLDLDIARLHATPKIDLKRVKPVTIKLSIQNASSVSGEATARLIGMQNGDQVCALSAPLRAERKARIAVEFSCTPTAAGRIGWTAILEDEDPDVDEATTTTIVK